MGDVSDRHDLHTVFIVLHAERLMKSKLAHSEFFVKSGDDPLEFFRGSCLSKCPCKIADAVADPLIKDFSVPVCVMIILDHVNTGSPNLLLHPVKVIIKQFFENFKIMKCCLIDTSFDLTYDLACSTVRILTVCQQ